MRESERIRWVDIAKCFAILLVVMGHSIQENIGSNSYFHRVIYSFHMPLFFVLSGLTFSDKMAFKDFARKKLKALMVPYVVFSFLYLFYMVFIAMLTQKPFCFDLVNTVLFTSKSIFSVYWFLPCLFFAELLFYRFKPLIENNKMGGVSYAYYSFV